MRHLLILTATMFLSACGQSSLTPRTLFSEWKPTSSGESPLFLLSVSYGQNQPLAFHYPTGVVCSCMIDLAGDDISGTYDIHTCSYSGGGSGDPGCSAKASTGNYLNVRGTLSFCTSNGCTNYR